MTRRLLAATALCAIVPGCYSPPQGSNVATSAPTPPGVVTIVSGVYPDSPCCWLAPNAVFETVVPARAKLLVLTVFTPDDIPRLRTAHQQVTVTVEGRRTTFSHVPIGTKILNVNVKPAAADRTVAVKMNMAVNFVPKQELGSADTRQLSIYLRAVRSF